MRVFYYLQFIVITGSLILLSSCVVPKRAVISKKMAVATTMTQSEKAKLARMEKAKAAKYEQEKIDAANNEKISERLQTYSIRLDSFNTAVDFIDSVIRTGKLFRKNKMNIKEQLVLIRNYNKDSPKRLRRFEMMEDCISLADQHLFNLAAFFGPGKYIIPPEKTNVAWESFSPVLDSLASFYKKYADVDRIATIIVQGYADGTGFNTEGEAYKSLAKLIGEDAPVKEVVNQKLSFLRAKTVADLMDYILSKKIDNYDLAQKQDFLFIETGKGEAFPSKKVRDYKESDDRRRIVLLFWSVLPK